MVAVPIDVLVDCLDVADELYEVCVVIMAVVIFCILVCISCLKKKDPICYFLKNHDQV